MKLSTRSRYGLKAMFELALEHGNDPVSLKTISKKQNISEHYLEQLIAIVKKKGLVQSVRGAKGGYLLSKKPENITIGEIIIALEGGLAPTECVNETESKKICINESNCVTRDIWIKIRDNLFELTNSITLKDMCDKQKVIKRRE